MVPNSIINVNNNFYRCDIPYDSICNGPEFIQYGECGEEKSEELFQKYQGPFGQNSLDPYYHQDQC